MPVTNLSVDFQLLEIIAIKTHPSDRGSLNLLAYFLQMC